MINLKLITQLVDIIVADKRPEYQRNITVYSDGFGRSVRVVEFVFINNPKELMRFEIEIGGQREYGNNWDKLGELLEVNGLELGEWSSDEVVSLTPLGEQEAALLSSVPYFFGVDPVLGD